MENGRLKIKKKFEIGFALTPALSPKGEGETTTVAVVIGSRWFQ